MIWFLLVFHPAAYAQFQALKFITYTTNEGLLHNYTRKCVEDNKGFIWIISETGISRFDGVNFTNFQHHENDSSSLPHNSVNDIAVDEEGRVWLATEKGLCFYNPKTSGFSSLDISGAYTNSPSVLALCVDKHNDKIWFMTDKALFQYSLLTNKIKSTSCINSTPTHIYHLYLSSDDRLWIAMYRDGFFLYDIHSDRTTHYLKQDWVTCFHEGSDHIMWIGNWSGDQLVSWNMNTGENKDWREKDELGLDKNMIVTGITESPFTDDSMLLVSSLHMGIRVFNIRLKKFMGGYNRDLFMKYSLPTDFTNYIYKDRKGIIWVCTWNGLCKMNALEQQFKTTEIPFLNVPMFQYYNLVEGIVASEKPGTWWLGINGCGLIQYDTSKKQIVSELLGNITAEKMNIDPGTWTEFLIETPDGVIWDGNDLGIARIDGNKVHQYDIRVNGTYPWKKSLCIGPDHTFWITTYTHLVQFDPGSGNYKVHQIDTSLHDPMPDGAIAESGFGGDGKLYIGTVKGLFRFDTRLYTSRRIPLHVTGADSLDVNTVNSLVSDNQESLYFGTPAGMIIYNIRTGLYQLKGKAETVYPILSKSMLRDKAGNIWIYTPHALFKYEPEKDEFSRFTTADGIYNFSSDGTHLFSFKNNFYIGYRGAFTEFDPLKVNANRTMVKPLITEVLIDTKLQKLNIDSFSNQILSLPAGKKEIIIHFTGIDYTNSDKITFLYKISEDTVWHEAGTNRSVTYTNLAPGNYVFRLKARNSSGILNEEAAVFNFYIAPTLLQRWWFWPSIALVFIAVVILLANQRVRKIREEEKLKTASNKMLAELETKLLRSQMNPHFIFNSLNSIQKYIWENKEEDAAEYLARFAKLIRAILENSRKEFITLKEELEVLKLYIELEHRRSNGKFDYHIQVSQDLNQDELLIPPLLLQPYIENAIWHGVNKKQSHGHIDITIGQQKNLLEISIDDDGVGRSFNQKEESEVTAGKVSMGTNITQQRISHLQTKTSLAGVQIIDKMKDGIPAGTTVIVTIPVKFRTYA